MKADLFCAVSAFFVVWFKLKICKRGVGMNRLSLFIVVCLVAFPFAGLCAEVQDMPMGQGAEGTVSMLPEETGSAVDELFGLEGGYLHPYLSLEGSFTDNLYNVDSDKTSNYLTRVSPGMWFTLPRKKIIPVTITPHNSSPGGLQQEIDDYEGTDRYQLYALAGADLFFYSEDSDLNTEDVTLEGLGRYNMPGGLSLQLLDRYNLGHDDFGFSGATEEDQREYESNLLMATTDWDITEKVRVKIDYSNFILMYDDSINEYLERQDDVVDAYGFYKYSVKTSLFLQYRYTAVNYDSATEKDNTQNSYYAGVRWDTTEKLALLFKAGMQQKEYDTETPDFDDSDNFVVDLQALYRATEKTEMKLNLYRLNEESDTTLASEKIVFGARFGYRQEFTEKITGKADLSYEKADYEELVDSDRDDDTYRFRPSAEYLFKDWLMGEMAYEYELRDSSESLFDYDTNTIFFSLNFAL
jgi:polysaccharide biosynthesis protein VpsM